MPATLKRNEEGRLQGEQERAEIERFRAKVQREFKKTYGYRMPDYQDKPLTVREIFGLFFSRYRRSR